jgi:FtsP/CotA-like multicopper oxidase with cupredoxin domain
VGELTVHLHGGHNRTQFDGYPGGLTKSQPRSFYCQIPTDLSPRESGNEYLIEPGARKTYVYDLMEDGHPERAAFQWYHDHRLDRTALHSWRGLAGMWIVDDKFDDSLPLPRGDRDLPLMIADRTFDARNQLINPFTNKRPPADGILGETVLVNGAYMPHHRVTPQRYRLRILNVSAFRSYNLQLSNGAPMIQIATESGLMPKPVRRKEILLGPAERVEVIVDFAGAAQPAGRPHLRRRADAVPGCPRPPPRPHPRPPPPAPAAEVDAEGQAQARPPLGDHDRRILQDHLADQRPHLQPGLC